MPSAESAGPDDRSGPGGPVTWSADLSLDLPRFEPTGEEIIYRGWVVTLTEAGFVDPDGRPFQRDVIRHPGAVAVVAVTDRRSVVLVQQYRPAVDAWVLEVPAGTRDVAGEDVADTARRELAEEAGYAAGTLTLLTRCLITPGFCDEESSLYLATALTPVPVDRQGVEEGYLRVVEVPLDRFDDLVDDGTIVDATTILGVGLARRHLTPDR